MKKEDFGCMYRIKEYFSDMDSQIKRFDCGTGENPAVEELKQKRKAMYEIVRELNRTDCANSILFAQFAANKAA